MHELPLIFFTLLVQASVGLTLFTLLGLRYANGALTAKERNRYAFAPLLTAFIAGSLGLIASTSHLGYPLNAFHALRHIESSWLSREILSASVYLAALGLCGFVMIFFKRVSTTLLLLVTLSGLINIFCMGAVYVHSAMATWTHLNTYLMFFGALIGLGATAILWVNAVRPCPLPQIAEKTARTVVGLLIAATLIRLIEQPIYFSYLSDAAANDAVTFPYHSLAAFEQLGNIRLAGWISLILATMLLALSLRGKSKTSLVLLGGALIVVAETLLRFSFFSVS